MRLRLISPPMTTAIVKWQQGELDFSTPKSVVTYRLRKSAKSTFLSFEQKHPHCIVADTPKKVAKALALMERVPLLGFDVETIGSDVGEEHPIGKAKVLSLQLAGRVDGVMWAVFVPNWGKYAGTLRKFKALLEGDKDKTAHNGKYDIHALLNHGVSVDGFLHDTLITDKLFATQEMLHGLKECMRRYFGRDAKDYKEVFKTPYIKKNGQPGKRMVLQPLEEVIKTQAGIWKLIDYAIKDPIYSVELAEYLQKKLEKVEWSKRGSYWDYYVGFEEPFIRVLVDVERNGMYIDQPKLNAIRVEIEEALTKAEWAFMKACVSAGVPAEFMESFNLNSQKQLAALFQKLGAKIVDLTPTGLPKVDEASLKKIKGGKKVKKVIKALLECRRLLKSLTTYVDPLLKYSKEYGGRVHTDLKHAGTATWRLSSANPNFQNVPTGAKDTYSIRGCIIAEFSTHVIADIDLSQIEMRLMAHFSRDKRMLQAIRDGWDLHSLAAWNLAQHGLFPEIKAHFGARELSKEVLAELAEVFPDQRKKAKTINFGVGYGMGPTRYAVMTGSSMDEGRRAIQAFFKGFPGLKYNIENVRKYAHEHGHIRTLLRKYVGIPFINHPDEGLRAAGERQAYNYLIQGSAAELLKMSMILIHNDEVLRGLGVKMIMQIHDELLFEMPLASMAEATPIIEDYVSHPYRYFGMKDLLVDTPADLGSGISWAEAKH